MKITSFSFLGAMILALVSGCAPADGFDGEPALGAQDDDPSLTAANDYGQTQAPPIKLMIYGTQGERVSALVATSTAVGSYAAASEYWFGASGMKPVGDFRIDALPLDLNTEQAIADFVSPMQEVFVAPRVVSPSDWTRGKLAFEDGQTPFLFWAPHPDNADQYLGVVLVVDASGQLVNTAWYRSSPPDESGRAFTSRVWSASLKQVLDEQGEPSADPNLIGRGDWFGIKMTR